MNNTRNIRRHQATQRNATNSNARAERARLNQSRFLAYPAGQSLDEHLSTEAVRHG